MKNNTEVKRLQIIELKIKSFVTSTNNQEVLGLQSESCVSANTGPGQCPTVTCTPTEFEC